MELRYYIEFKSKPPEREAILQKLKENTGLDIEFDKISSTHFFHPSLPKGDWVWLSYENNDVIIITGRLDMWYLMAATFTTLIDLGGSLTKGCGFKFPDWAWKKWEKVKDIQTTYPLWIEQPDGSIKLNEMFKLEG